MADGKTRVAVVGCGGRMSVLLEDLLDRYEDSITIASLCDPNETALGIAKKRLGYNGPVTTDYRKAIAAPGVTWVLVGSRNDLHAAHCVAAFEAGKDVFCEKPIAITVEQCERIREAHRRSQTRFATGFVLRFHPVFVALEREVRAGTLGKLVSLEANETLRPGHGGYIMRNWRRFKRFSGGHLLEKGCHDIDLIQWLVGSLPHRVAAFAGTDIYVPENRTVGEKLAQEADDPSLFTSWSSWEDVDPFTSDKDIDDNLVAIMEFRNGVRVCFHHNSLDAMQPRGMHICGLEGTAELDVRSDKLAIRRVGRQNMDIQLPERGRGGHGGTDGPLVDELAGCMMSDAQPRIPGEEGIRSAVICLAIEEARTTGTVVDCEQYWKRFGL